MRFFPKTNCVINCNREAVRLNLLRRTDVLPDGLRAALARSGGELDLCVFFAFSNWVSVNGSREPQWRVYIDGGRLDLPGRRRPALRNVRKQRVRDADLLRNHDFCPALYCYVP